MVNEERLVMRKLRSMLEDDLTKTVIIPLLEKLGFQRVEYYGGGLSEEGKDIVCWKLDEIGEPELTVAQVKHFKVTRSASDSRSFETVVNQLINASSKALPYVDKFRYLPTRVYLISTYQIDTKTVKKRFDAYPTLQERQLKIIDGPKLAHLVLEHIPHIASELLGPGIEIAAEIRPKLNNESLLAAIGFHGTKDLNAIYTDIDFSLGKRTTRLFFGASFKPTTEKFKFRKDEWSQFKSVFASISAEFPLDFLGNTVELVDGAFESKTIAHEEWNERLASLESDIQSAVRKLNENKKKYTRAEKALLKTQPQLKEKRQALNKLVEKSQKLAERIQNLVEKKKKEKSLAKESDKLSKESDKLSKEEDKLSKEIYKLEAPLAPFAKKYEKDENALRFLFKSKDGLMKQEPQILCDVKFHGKTLAHAIEDNRLWIEQRIRQFNTNRPAVEEVKLFVEKCKAIIDAASLVLGDPYCSKCIGADDKQVQRKDFENTRMELPIKTVFDTGLNITVLGGAGAGKTTSLQVYTLNKLESGSDEKLFIYAPLAHVIRVWLKNEHQLSKSSSHARLDYGIALYLAQLGISITPSEFAGELRRKGGVLLLDGVDEAIKSAPWLLEEIRILAEKYTEAQIIISSRMSGSYLEEIPFIAVTLLPFTNDQRSEFVKKWFGEDDQAHVERIERHIRQKKVIGEIVKNPLLTTILCVLEKNEIALPDNVIRLYEERLRLLTGYYDIAKGIHRVSSPQQMLELLSRRLGFFLHSKNKREEDKAVLQEAARRLMIHELKDRNAVIALDELDDPCNILVPMTEDGKLGFGHLSYQEYLAAQELLVNRSVHPVSLLPQPWWRGVFVLFAQMNVSIDWLIDEAVEEMEVGSCQETLHAMISARPRNERTKLREMVLLHSRQDAQESVFRDWLDAPDGLEDYYDLLGE